MINKKILIICFAICLAVLLLIWSSLSPRTAVDEPIRIATNPWPGYEFLHLADKKGFFKEEGVNVRLVRFSALEDARRAYERGQVDGMAATLVDLLQAREHGRLAKIIFATDFSNGSDIIVARKDIHSLADLKGKKIGVESESFSLYVIARALEQAHLSLDDVKLESMDQLNIAEALLKGEIDATHTYPPYSTELMKHQDQVVQLFDSAQMPGEILDIVAIDPALITDRPEDIQAMRRAWDKAVAYGKAHPDEANDIMAHVEGIDVKDFDNALSGVKVLSLAEQEPYMVHGGTLEHVLVQVNDLLHIKNAADPVDFINHTEGH